MLVVFEAVSDVQPGVYKVLSQPYCTHALIGHGWLHPRALKRIADLNPDMDGEGYPCGHLCLECQKKLLAQFQGKCSVCLNKSASCLRVKLGSWKDRKGAKWTWTPAKVVCAACRHSHRGSWEPVFQRSNP